ncbi:xanthine dehydrogenase family protein molybdopterin-binding subunit [Anaerotignum sp.]|uniref:xanthine dehydrogenase family protein molybdopterin-binding subunit n=1 Tax=Anaerotignum sp. TaxID=2039241 RepID=UPI002A91249D|nr:molybdopterin cofactor-binding domain-containing protein [Anaerotignum sp.]MCI7656528.1 molybdopterin-dependent oxidoreductase [Clostridia bacterium]MDY5416038.1 molybdopterin cofactor-binding domain-containing protein [Anaerotignum sp.]
MKYVNQPIRKKDAMALVTGKPVYTDDIAPKDCLVVKVLRSPHAHAEILEIKKDIAEKLPGIVCVLTYEDVPQKRFTMAGQTYPEPSPYDRLILDKRVRFVGDAVAIVAGETEKAVDQAMKVIKVKYNVLEPVLDFHEAKDNPILVHPEDNWQALCPVGADNKRNLCASGLEEHGDVDKVIAESDVVVENTYHTKAVQQTMMETFRTYTQMDTYGRLNIISSTQVPFHVRRILSNALDIPKSKIRVIKPRIGGGFGAKQTVVAEVYPAIVTLKTGRPAKIIYTREESLIASSPRHEMEIKVRIGANKDGHIRGIEVKTLSNTGAFGEHGPTTVGLSGHKSIPLYSKAEAFRFQYDVVYTNKMSAGAYRGYGATQGIFAVESAINELAVKLDMDPVALREMNLTREGDVMHGYYGETATSCTLDRCLERTAEMIGWKEKYPRRVMPDGKIRGVGIAMAMQGSGIPSVDTGSVSIKINDDGFYALTIGASDMGTGCDTILSQMAADCLDCSVDDIIVYGVDTDVSPYDSGSYASSTTYVTGMATVKACQTLVDKMKAYGAEKLGCSVDDVEFDGEKVYSLKDGSSISRKDIGNAIMCAGENALFATEAHSSPVSPPPFMAGAVEVEVDPETGSVKLMDFAAVVDCGTVVNPNLARVQVEGGLVQGIGMALHENITYNEKGELAENSLMQYKIPTRMDMGKLRVEFDSSYEPTGPFGAKSIGEIVINTPAPAIAQAIYNATGLRFTELPITPEKIAMGMMDK